MVCGSSWSWTDAPVLRVPSEILVYSLNLVFPNCAQEYLDRIEHSGENLAFYLWFQGVTPSVQCSSVDYKKRFYEMPLDLQELSPNPNLDDAVEFTQKRIPRIAVRGRTDPSSPSGRTNEYSSPIVGVASLDETDSRSSDEKTLSPASVTPWEKGPDLKLEPRPTTAHSESFTTSTNERHSSDASQQPFRHEVFHRLRNILISG